MTEKEQRELDEKIAEIANRPRDSWRPINLNNLPEKPPTEPTLGGASLIYPGKRHVFSGPPESAKTLAAYCLLIQTIRHGGKAILFDFEMGMYDARQRLRELGATDEEIDSVYYLEPDETATPARLGALLDLEPQLVVVDAGAGIYNLEGLDDNKRADVEKISRLYIGTFWRAGVATITLDHVTKDAEQRGRFVIGSERKLGAADVHIGFETVRAISRGSTGRYKLVTHKDRGGYLRRGHVADLHLDSDPDTHAISWRFMTPDIVADDLGFRPTHLMEKAAIKLEMYEDEPTRTELAAAIGGRRKYALQAIDRLLAEHFAEETPGPRGAKLIRLLKPYREDDPGCNPDTPEAPAPVVLCSSDAAGMESA